MDVEKLIEAAEYCESIGSVPEGVYDCRRCFNKYGECMTKNLDESHIVAIKSHYETLLASERSKVIAEVREWAEKAQIEMYGPLRQSVVLLSELNLKFDSMDRGDGE